MRPLINPIRTRIEEEIPLVEARVNGGMVTTIDSADLNNNQFVSAKNARIRDDVTSKRLGYYFLPVTEPDNNRVLLFTPYKKYDNSIVHIRFTPSSIYKYTGAAWVAQAGALSGGNFDRFSTAIINNRFFFANGVDNVKELDTTTDTFVDAGNWDKYRFITGFFNRIVGANLSGAASKDPVRIAWSGDLNFLETDPGVDLSAGFDFLAESPSDYADFITGLVSFPSMLLIAKEKSIWGAIKQASATSPFLFQTIVPGIGCDCPYSVQRIPAGMCWVDYRTRRIYAYMIGTSVPVSIGDAVDKTLIPQIEDVYRVFSDYNPLHDEYKIAIPSVSSDLVRIWTYNFRTKAWAFDEMNRITMVNTIDFGAPPVATQMVGDDFGRVNFELDISNNDPNGDTVIFELESKIFTLPNVNEYITEVKLELLVTQNGNISLYYSTDGKAYVLHKTFNVTTSSKRQLFSFKKNLRCRQYQFKLTSNLGHFDILGYEVLYIPSGRSTR